MILAWYWVRCVGAGYTLKYCYWYSLDTSLNQLECTKGDSRCYIFGRRLRGHLSCNLPPLPPLCNKYICDDGMRRSINQWGGRPKQKFKTAQWQIFSTELKIAKKTLPPQHYDFKMSSLHHDKHTKTTFLSHSNKQFVLVLDNSVSSCVIHDLTFTILYNVLHWHFPPTDNLDYCSITPFVISRASQVNKGKEWWRTRRDFTAITCNAKSLYTGPW